MVAQRNPRDRGYLAHALDLSDELQADFRDRAIATLGEYERDLLPVPFAENAMLSDHEYAVADSSVLDPELVRELLRAGAVSPDREHPPVPNLLRLSAVVAQGGGHEVLLVRRQNPVRHLAGNPLTLTLSHSRLSRSDTIFVYDAKFDLMVFDRSVAIRSQAAFDAVFRDDVQRVEETAKAVREAAQFIRRGDRGVLEAAAAGDMRYAAKLRRSLLGGVFEAVDMDAVRSTIDEFNLELRIEGGRLAFPRTRTGRWELIYVLEDAFVLGRATGRRYRANSKRPWQRRSIDRVTVEGQRVTEVRGPGDWSPRSDGKVIADLLGPKPIEYVARLAGGPALVEVRGHGPEQQLWVPGDDDAVNRLLELAGPTAGNA